ncbi:hypothetical protein AMTR_s00142p00080680 [Amborella trichopoda]|uniref:Uncharacterized protein n=1 Tax=Amborella trichopoda TaxID=13333 RepID=W1PDM3_AMBTC|nr:hypothetical protein AMTR_s00142p00080680 [Amborella trichopoda]
MRIPPEHLLIVFATVEFFYTRRRVRKNKSFGVCLGSSFAKQLEGDSTGQSKGHSFDCLGCRRTKNHINKYCCSSGTPLPSGPRLHKQISNNRREGRQVSQLAQSSVFRCSKVESCLPSNQVWLCLWASESSAPSSRGFCLGSPRAG